MEIITLCANKGGVGKTTIALNLAYALKQRKKRVLLVDTDKQCNLTTISGANSIKGKKTILDFYKGAKLSEVITTTESGLDLVPGDKNNDETEADSFYKAIKALKYDYVIIDTSANINELTRAFMVISDRILIPLKLDILSYQGLSQLYPEILDKKIGAIVTMSDLRTKISQLAKAQIEQFCKAADITLYKSMIRQSCAIPESFLMGAPVMEYAPKSNPSIDFENLCNEILIE
jgi:chromosome partitioning protein